MDKWGEEQEGLWDPSRTFLFRALGYPMPMYGIWIAGAQKKVLFPPPREQERTVYSSPGYIHGSWPFMMYIYIPIYVKTLNSQIFLSIPCAHQLKPNMSQESQEGYCVKLKSPLKAGL